MDALLDLERVTPNRCGTLCPGQDSANIGSSIVDITFSILKVYTDTLGINRQASTLRSSATGTALGAVEVTQ